MEYMYVSKEEGKAIVASDLFGTGNEGDPTLKCECEEGEIVGTDCNGGYMCNSRDDCATQKWLDSSDYGTEDKAKCCKSLDGSNPCVAISSSDKGKIKQELIKWVAESAVWEFASRDRDLEHSGEDSACYKLTVSNIGSVKVHKSDLEDRIDYLIKDKYENPYKYSYLPDVPEKRVNTDFKLGNEYVDVDDEAIYVNYRYVKGLGIFDRDRIRICRKARAFEGDWQIYEDTCMCDESQVRTTPGWGDRLNIEEIIATTTTTSIATTSSETTTTSSLTTTTSI